LRNKNIFYLKSNFKRGGFFKTENKKKLQQQKSSTSESDKTDFKPKKNHISFQYVVVLAICNLL